MKYKKIIKYGGIAAIIVPILGIMSIREYNHFKIEECHHQSEVSGYQEDISLTPDLFKELRLGEVITDKSKKDGLIKLIVSSQNSGDFKSVRMAFPNGEPVITATDDSPFRKPDGQVDYAETLVPRGICWSVLKDYHSSPSQRTSFHSEELGQVAQKIFVYGMAKYDNSKK